MAEGRCVCGPLRSPLRSRDVGGQGKTLHAPTLFSGALSGLMLILSSIAPLAHSYLVVGLIFIPAPGG